MIFLSTPLISLPSFLIIRFLDISYYPMSDSEVITGSSSPHPPVSNSTRSAFRPPKKTVSAMALLMGSPLVSPGVPPILEPLVTPMVPHSQEQEFPRFMPPPTVTSVASALFAMTTPVLGDGSALKARERWQSCIWAVINKDSYAPRKLDELRYSRYSWLRVQNLTQFYVVSYCDANTGTVHLTVLLSLNKPE